MAIEVQRNEQSILVPYRIINQRLKKDRQGWEDLTMAAPELDILSMDRRLLKDTTSKNTSTAFEADGAC